MKLDSVELPFFHYTKYCIDLETLEKCHALLNEAIFMEHFFQSATDKEDD